MPKKKHQFNDKNANKKQKLLYDNSASEHSILRINQPSLMLDKMICLTDSIYGSSVPKGLEGYLFCYKVVGYDSEKQRFKTTFQLRIIKDDGHEWKHMDGEREELDGLTYDHVKDGLEVYNRALGRVKAHEYKKDSAAKETLKRKTVSGEYEINEDEVDMTDLDMAAHEAREDGGWMSQSVLEVSSYIFSFFFSYNEH